MLDFTFQNPVKIIFGAGRIAEIDAEIPRDARVLVVYGGGSVRRNGALDEAKAALGGRFALEFGGVEPNPAYETLMRAAELVRAERIDFLLAVGGGSVIDGTKFVAAAAHFDGEPWDILAKEAPVRRAVPFGVVLTLPATGSEMNSGAVVTRRGTQDKLVFGSPLVFPRFAALDPTKTFTLPPNQTANGVVDAFVHVMEQYLTYPARAAAQDRFSEGLLATLIEEGPKALAEPRDYDARANVMWCATLALNGLIGAGVPQDWATHMLGHEITALYGVDHARTLAIVLPAMMERRRGAKREKLLQYGERVWGIAHGTEEERIDEAIAKTRAFFELLGVPTRLSDYGIGPDAVDRLVAQLERHGLTKLGERNDVDPPLARLVFETAL
ncbi:MAG: iron-containing alcohol dehydrogenase [Candidatus Polarisedimenticolia bacterium]|nr:iron-containing alcohol dehydrogenase [bacterium]